MNKIVKSLWCASLLVSFWSLPSCREDNSDDITDSGSLTTATFSISTRAPEEVLQPNQNATLSNELMHSWRVLFVKAGVVKYVVTGDPIGDESKREDSFSLAMAPGSYDIYAFANLDELGDTGNAIANMKAGDAANFSTVSLNAIYTDENKLIPMSRHLRHEVKANDKTGTDIELIRMLGKVEFEFTNDADSNISISAISFGQLYGTPVSLLPEFSDGTQVKAPSFDAQGSSHTWTFTEPVSLPANSTDAGKVYKHFYVHETSALQHPTGQFYLSVTLKRGGEGGEQGEGGETETEEQRYALAGGSDGTLLTAIRRNDYIQIPVKLTNWIVDLEARFYPPIGGYPDKDITTAKGEFYVTFGSSGKFELVPTVRRKAGDAPLRAPEVTMTITEVEDPAGILTGTGDGKIKNEGGEFLGELTDNVTAGTAVVTVEFEVKDENLIRKFTRKIYIKRT